MIIALLNQKGGVGKTTLALHLAGQWAKQSKRIILINADPQGSALDWSEQRAREGLPRLFGVVGLARYDSPGGAGLARDVRHLIIDGPPRIAGLMRSALLAADLVLIPAHPSPFDGWASGEMLKLLAEARIFRPQLVARFVLNRCAARTVIARDTVELLAERSACVDDASRATRQFRRRGPQRPVGWRDRRPRPGRSRDRRACRRNPETRTMSAGRKRDFAIRPTDTEAWMRAPENASPRDPVALRFTARLTIDVMSELRGRIKVTAF